MTNTSEQIYNSRVINTYVDLIKTKYPHVNIKDILQRAGIKEYEVTDQGHWHSQEQVNRFYELITTATGNENIAREAGRYAATPGVLGMLRQYALGLVGPAGAFAMIEKIATKLTRSAHYTSKKIGANKVEICVEPIAGFREESYTCENRQGFFEAIVTVFNLPMPKIDHNECMFKGGSRCRYIVSWEPTGAAALQKVRNWTIPVVIGAIAATGGLAPALLPWVAPPAVLTVLCISLAAALATNNELARGLQNLWTTSEQLADQISVNYRNTQLAQDVGTVISSKRNLDDVVHSIMQVLQQKMDFDRGLILLADKDRKKLEIRGAYGYDAQHFDILSNLAFNLDNPASKGMFVVAFHTQKPFLINDVNEVEEQLSPRSKKFVSALRIKSFICVPIVLEDESIGILAVDNLTTKKPLMVSDMNMIQGVAPVIGVSIHNARLAEEQKAQFEATLRIMADSIDARDFLTAGHSEKVADFAEGIAVELGLDAEFVEIIRVSALLHDYGKIGVPDTILKKPGQLSPEERSIIRTHPTRTREILEQVPFKGAYTQIPQIAASHHEAWDGSGYPLGLKSEAIPLGARILAVADFFEAITALRHYRAPMPLDEALAEVTKESGKRFQPELVQALLRHIEKTRVCLLDHKPKKIVGPERSSPRLPYRTQVSVEVDNRVISGTSVNLSSEGIFIRTPELAHLKPGARVSITFALPSPEELVSMPAEVAWLNDGSPRCSTDLPSGFGAKFQPGTLDTAEKIGRYISRAKAPQTTQFMASGPEGHNPTVFH